MKILLELFSMGTENTSVNNPYNKMLCLYFSRKALPKYTVFHFLADTINIISKANIKYNEAVFKKQVEDLSNKYEGLNLMMLKIGCKMIYQRIKIFISNIYYPVKKEPLTTPHSSQEHIPAKPTCLFIFNNLADNLGEMINSILVNLKPNISHLHEQLVQIILG